MNPFENETVKIDVCHALLILGLVSAHKPKRILEIGIGGGRATDEILRGIEYNQNNAEYTIVDNFCDFGGNSELVTERYGSRVKNIINSNEKDFVYSTKEEFDFIMSDADHHHTHEWFEHVFNNLLLPNGILIYHDVNVFEFGYPNLLEIYDYCKTNKLSHFLFNESSLPDERCGRGLLVIFKN